MHKNATKCKKTQRKWCINKDGASKIIDTLETYQAPASKAWFAPRAVAPDHPTASAPPTRKVSSRKTVITRRMKQYLNAGKHTSHT
jgi:hypothetical protein